MTIEKHDRERHKLPPFQDKLEREVVHCVAAEFPEFGGALLDQFEHAEIVDRYTTMKGFYTDYKVPDSCPLLTGANEIVETYVQACFPSNGVDAGFLLYQKNGRFDCLEGYTYGDGTGDTSWPKLREPFRIYIPEVKRIGSTILFEPPRQ